MNKTRWYETEDPVIEQAGPIRLQWFPRNGRLQLVAIRTDPMTLEQRPGLTFTLKLQDLCRNDKAIALLERVVEIARQGLSQSSKPIAW